MRPDSTASGQEQLHAISQRTPLRDYPWGAIAGNVAGIGAAHALGYISAGTMAHMLMKSRFGEHVAKMKPATRRALLGAIVGTAGTGASLAATAASTAGQARIAEILARRELKRRQSAQ